MGLFENRKQINGKTQVPVWFMRQAGRYHDHYQNLKKSYDFMTLCKDPDLATEVTMGPIEAFDFDAAILFSDLLFPLEQLSLGLNYEQGPPRLEFHLKTKEDLKKLRLLQEADYFYDFQRKATEKIRKVLPKEKDLLGFVGAPFTLFTYATEGSHAGNLKDSKTGLYDGRFEQFCDILLPELIREMEMQAEGGAQAVCLFDTAAGELSFHDYQKFIIPVLKKITKTFKKDFPETKIVYYSKHTHLPYLEAIEDENIDVMGVDWRVDITDAMKRLGENYYVQGNIDPIWLHLPWQQLQKNLELYHAQLEKSNFNFSRWICGLGHGVTVGTPQDNVLKTVQHIHKNWLY